MKEGMQRPPAEEGNGGPSLNLFRRQVEAVKAESRTETGPEGLTNGHKEDVMKNAKKMFKGLEDTINQNVMKMRPAWWSSGGAASSHQSSRSSPSSADVAGSQATGLSSSKQQASASSTSSTSMGPSSSQNVDNTAMTQHFVSTERLVRMGLSPQAAKVAMHHLDDWVVSAIGSVEMGTAEATAMSLGEQILRMGDVVTLQNMDRKNHQCNGLQGTLEAYSAENQRWLVALHSDGQKYWIRPTYLEPIEAKGPMSNAVVGELDVAKSADPAWMEACTNMLAQREEIVRKKQESLEAREIQLLEREERIMSREESLRQFEDSLRKSQASVEATQQLLGRQRVSLASEQARVMKEFNGGGHEVSMDAIAPPVTMERALSEGSTSKDGSTVGGEADEVWDMDWAELATHKAAAVPPVPFGRTLSDSCSSDAGSTSFVDTSNPTRPSGSNAERQESGAEATSPQPEDASSLEAAPEVSLGEPQQANQSEEALLQAPEAAPLHESDEEPKQVVTLPTQEAAVAESLPAVASADTPTQDESKDASLPGPLETDSLQGDNHALTPRHSVEQTRLADGLLDDSVQEVAGFVAEAAIPTPPTPDDGLQESQPDDSLWAESTKISGGTTAATAGTTAATAGTMAATAGTMAATAGTTAATAAGTTAATAAGTTAATAGTTAATAGTTAASAGTTAATAAGTAAAAISGPVDNASQQQDTPECTEVAGVEERTQVSSESAPSLLDGGAQDFLEGAVSANQANISDHLGLEENQQAHEAQGDSKQEQNDLLDGFVAESAPTVPQLGTEETPLEAPFQPASLPLTEEPAENVLNEIALQGSPQSEELLNMLETSQPADLLSQSPLLSNVVDETLQLQMPPPAKEADDLLDEAPSQSMQDLKQEDGGHIGLVDLL